MVVFLINLSIFEAIIKFIIHFVIHNILVAIIVKSIIVIMFITNIINKVDLTSSTIALKISKYSIIFN